MGPTENFAFKCIACRNTAAIEGGHCARCIKAYNEQLNAFLKKGDMSKSGEALRNVALGQEDIICSDEFGEALKRGEPLWIVKNPADPKEGQASKKLCFDSVPSTALCNLAEACQSGADKYGPHNWLNLEDGTMSMLTYINAIQRHLILLRAGQDNASDSGIHHLKHIMAGCAVALDAMEFGKVSDDRIKLSEEQIVQLEKLIVK